MSGQARFEVVRTDAEQPWHARLIVNGRVTWWTENYTRKVGAERAVLSVVRAVTGAGAGALRLAPSVPGVESVVINRNRYSWAEPVRYVDERGAK